MLAQVWLNLNSDTAVPPDDLCGFQGLAFVASEDLTRTDFGDDFRRSDSELLAFVAQWPIPVAHVVRDAGAGMTDKQ